jgi:hypothetical protein
VEHVHVGDGGQAIVGNVKTHDHLEGSPPQHRLDPSIEHEENRISWRDRWWDFFLAPRRRG